MHDSPKDAAAPFRDLSRAIADALGVFGERAPGAPASPAEARLLGAIGNAGGVTAAALSRELRLDRGYLSRLLARLEQSGLVRRAPNPRDARARTLHLAPAGQTRLAELERLSGEQAQAVLAALPPGKRRRLLAAMEVVATLLGEALDKQRMAAQAEPEFTFE